MIFYASNFLNVGFYFSFEVTEKQYKIYKIYIFIYTLIWASQIIDYRRSSTLNTAIDNKIITVVT